MVGSINPNNNFAFQPAGNSPIRDRNDAVRSPASAPERAPQQAREDLAATSAQSTEQTQSSSPLDQIQRRVQAQRAADDVQLERFRADELPRATSNALNTFAQVASGGNEPADVLTGIDIRI